jgi:hypothetical protein
VAVLSSGQSAGYAEERVASTLARFRAHTLHPIRDGMTHDRTLGKPGVANFADEDWRVRTLAVRDLVRLGKSAAPPLASALSDPNPHVRHVSAMVLGPTSAGETRGNSPEALDYPEFTAI